MKPMFAVIILGLAPTGPLSAQVPGPPPQGSRVHVVSKQDGLIAEGALVRLAADTVVLSDGRRQQAFSLGGDRQLERFAGRQIGTWNGARTFGLVGALVGAVLGAGASGGNDCGFLCSTPVEGALAGGVALGLVGLATGAVLGSLSSEEVWRPVETTGLRVSFSVRQGRALGFGAALSF